MADPSGYNGIETVLVLLCKVLTYLLSALAYGIFAVLFAQVLYRYVFSLPLYWVEELAKYLMIYVTTIGAAVAFRKEGHPRLQILYQAIGTPGRLWYELALRVPMALFLGMLVTVGYGYAQTNAWIMSPGLQISFFWPFMAIPIGAGICLVVLALDSLDILLYRRSWLMNVGVPDAQSDMDEIAE